MEVDTNHQEDQHFYGIAVVVFVSFMQLILNKFEYDILSVNRYVYL